MRSNAHTPSSSTRPRRGRTADVADTRRRHQPPADPRPAPSNTAARTANSPGILAWALFRVDSQKQLPATSTTPTEKRRRTRPINQIEQHPATGQETPEKAFVLASCVDCISPTCTYEKTPNAEMC